MRDLSFDQKRFIPHEIPHGPKYVRANWMTHQWIDKNILYLWVPSKRERERKGENKYYRHSTLPTVSLIRFLDESRYFSRTVFVRPRGDSILNVFFSILSSLHIYQYRKYWKICHSHRFLSLPLYFLLKMYWNLFSILFNTFQYIWVFQYFSSAQPLVCCLNGVCWQNWKDAIQHMWVYNSL